MGIPRGECHEHFGRGEYAPFGGVVLSRANYAGRRTDFRDKKSTDFSGEIFLERNYCPRTGFSGSNP